jgi:hypothetical protein
MIDMVAKNGDGQDTLIIDAIELLIALCQIQPLFWEKCAIMLSLKF